MDESDLIKRAQNGDKSAFESLLQEYYDVMFKMAYKFCGNPDDAADITQNACIKLARSIGSFRFKSAFSSWLYRLVINTGKDLYRSRKPEISLESGHVGAVKAEAETKTYANEVLTQIYALPDNERTALILVMSEDLTHKEAAAIMGCKESTVSWYIHEARKKLGVREESKRSAGNA